MALRVLSKCLCNHRLPIVSRETLAAALLIVSRETFAIDLTELFHVKHMQMYATLIKYIK